MSQRKTLTLHHDRYTVTLYDDSPFESSSLPDLPVADHVYELGDIAIPTSQHQVICYTAGAPPVSCLLRAGSGPSIIHGRSSLLHDESCLVAVGSFLAALRLPDLELLWATKVDMATCFGVYHSAKYASYISHGELEIARVTYDGTILWSCGGRDIFTNGFTLLEDHIEVIDFYDGKYHIDLVTGQSSLLLSQRDR